MNSIRYFSLSLLTAVVFVSQVAHASPDIDDACEMAQKVVEVARSGTQEVLPSAQQLISNPVPTPQVVAQQEIQVNNVSEADTVVPSSLLSKVTDAAANAKESVKGFFGRFSKKNSYSFADAKAYVIKQGGAVVEYAKDHPYYVAGVAALVTVGGFSFYLYKNGYFQPVTRAAQKSLAVVCGFKKTLAFLGMAAVAGAAGAVAYKYGYIADADISKARADLVKQSAAIQENAKACGSYVVGKADALKETVKGYFNRAKAMIA